MRLAKINTIKEANQFLIKFWKNYNKKFTVPAKNPNKAFQKVDRSIDLDKILCFKETRTLTKNLEFQYENEIYQIVNNKACHNLSKAKITVCKTLDGVISVEYRGKQLPFKAFGNQCFIGREVSSKELALSWNTNRKKRMVPENHPWKQKRLQGVII